MKTNLKAVLDQLKAQLVAQAVTDAPGVKVDAGYPVGGPQEEHIWIVGDPEIQSEYTISGLDERDDTITVKVQVLNSKTTTDYAEVLERNLELVNVVEDALAGDFTLDDEVLQAVVLSTKWDEGLLDEQTREVGALITLQISAYV